MTVFEIVARHNVEYETKQHNQTHINIQPENECIDYCFFFAYDMYIVVDSLS